MGRIVSIFLWQDFCRLVVANSCRVCHFRQRVLKPNGVAVVPLSCRPQHFDESQRMTLGFHLWLFFFGYLLETASGNWHTQLESETECAEVATSGQVDGHCCLSLLATCSATPEPWKGTQTQWPSGGGKETGPRSTMTTCCAILPLFISLICEICTLRSRLVTG